ncbi:hypothetical protein [Olivibacter sitiensis]|uniref:hypothetical protein n=1 Tax=Olivibacter sitiensis TaxID=376470 RepID=UPI00041C0364|nr:hypothetical protein [Olivibacter sitiensis]
MQHLFHIPVLGLAFSIDTPLAVAKYGITSVISIVDDELIERMRAYHCKKNDLLYQPILATDYDSRAARITAYLNLLQDLIDRQVENMKAAHFGDGGDLDRYFELLPNNHVLKEKYHRLRCTVSIDDRHALERELKGQMAVGEIQANIMAKVDKVNENAETHEVMPFSSDALAALRGFANSKVSSGLVLSAGLNQHLYSYIATFPDFYPDSEGQLMKRIILKVSDYRSAYIQARLLAKKGIWVSEYRIESGLNCGGHAFATDGYLLGPILEEFRDKRQAMSQELFAMYRQALVAKGYDIERMPQTRYTVQGGIGNADEQRFLLDYYQLDGTGWGSPFLLVPEATNVDDDTLNRLVEAQEQDFYVSDASPLGIPFNNFRKSTAEDLRLQRLAQGKPGNPCTKKYLISNTEYGGRPICTASNKYQSLKIKELKASGLSSREFRLEVAKLTEKTCLCEGLSSAAYIKKGILGPKESKAVAICPGPNLAWFSGPYSLDEMIGHIYGRINLLNGKSRPNLFVNELLLYIAHLNKHLAQENPVDEQKHAKYIAHFREQLLNGIDYYKSLSKKFKAYPLLNEGWMLLELASIESELQMSDETR